MDPTSVMVKTPYMGQCHPNTIQREFQDPKVEVLYHIKPYFGDIPLHNNNSLSKLSKFKFVRTVLTPFRPEALCMVGTSNLGTIELFNYWNSKDTGYKKYSWGYDHILIRLYISE